MNINSSPLFLILRHFVFIFLAQGLTNGDAATQAALQQAYPTITYPGIGNIGIGNHFESFNL